MKNLPALLFVALLHCACGSTGKPGMPDLDGEVTVIVYRADVDAGRMTGHVGDEETDEQVIEETAARLGARLADADAPVNAGARPFGDTVEILIEGGSHSAEDLAWVRRRVEQAGHIQFRIVATTRDIAQGEIELERQRLFRWLDGHPDTSVLEYNALPPSLGGPRPDLSWGQADQGAWLPLLKPVFPHWEFGGEDLREVVIVEDQMGFPAIQTQMSSARRSDFAQFTEAHLNRLLALVLDGQVLSTPALRVRLEGPFLIVGQFDNAEIEAIAAALRSGPLPVPLREIELRVDPPLPR